MSSLIESSNLQGCTRVNKLGRVFSSGQPLPETVRHKILKLSQQGLRASEISRILRISQNCVGTILKRFRRTGSILPKSNSGSYSPSPLMSSDVITKIFQLKREIPAMPASEIRQCLRDESICTPDRLPSVYLIKRLLNKMPELPIPTQQIQNYSYQTPDCDLNSSTNVTVVPLLSELKETNDYSIPNSSKENDSEREQIQLRNNTPTTFIIQCENNHIQNINNDFNLTVPYKRQQPAIRKYFTADERKILEKEFERTPYPDPFLYRHLSKTMQVEEYRLKTWFANRRFQLRPKKSVHNTRFRRNDCELQTDIVDLQPTVSSSISDNTIKSNISQGYSSIDNQQDLSRLSINYSCSSSAENDFRDFLISDESSSSSSSSSCDGLEHNTLTLNTMCQSCGCTGGQMKIINEASGFGPGTEVTLTSDQITLSAFDIAVVHMPTTENMIQKTKA